MKYDLNKIMSTALQAALKAGELIAEYRSENKVETGYKDKNDLVTSADIAAEKLIIEFISHEFPDHKILSEESAPKISNKADYLSPLWIIDPIDGTTNYASGHHQCAVSIAWACEGQVKVGVVHAPFLQETFQAVIGQGASLNKKKIKIRPDSSLDSALIATGFRRRAAFDPEMKQLRAILANCRDLRRQGSAALDICWVACGRLDGYYETVNTWDFAAAGLIAREAGALTGHIYDLPADLEMPQEFYGHEILVSTPAIYQELRQLLTVR